MTSNHGGHPYNVDAWLDRSQQPDWTGHPDVLVFGGPAWHVAIRRNTRTTRIGTIYQVNDELRSAPWKSYVYLPSRTRIRSQAPLPVSFAKKALPNWQTIGAGALNQAVKALAIARGFMAPSGVDLICRPAFTDLEVDGSERTAIRLMIEPK